MARLRDGVDAGNVHPWGADGGEDAGIRAEVIVPDNGSSDASTEIAARLGARVVWLLPRPGLAALESREHVSAASGDDGASR
jgi:hypothetical protein